MRIVEGEYRDRCEYLRRVLETQGLSGAVLFDPFYLLYYSGFAFIPTERPMAFLMHVDGETGLFVPRLELEHARQNAIVEQVYSYPEYPAEPHPMVYLKEALDTLGLDSRIGVDTDGYPWVFGYRGPAVSDILERPVRRLLEFIEDQMMIKSPAEISLIQESVRWGNLAHTLLQRYTRSGLTETEVSQRASQEATRAMLDAIGPVYRAHSPFTHGASAGYRGQIGRQAAIPHALASNLTFRQGDVLVTGAGAPVWGYHSELERTMVIGPPTDEQKRLFEHMLALQDLALASMRPGVSCAEIDRVTLAYFETHNLTAYRKHHVGHAIGLRYHEAPFLDLGDPTVLRPGMVFTVEPGLYVPGLGGFRHSDTVVITENGIDILTYYPRDLDSLTLSD